MALHIRSATARDQPVVDTALREAAFWRPEQREDRPSVEAAVAIDELRHYRWDPLRGSSIAVVALVDGDPAGAAWAHCFTEDAPGYGFVDEATPELGIGVAEPHRGRGIGRALLAALFVEAAAAGHEQLSLSVEHDNPSRHLYASMGFEPVGGVAPDDGALTMLRPMGGRGRRLRA